MGNGLELWTLSQDVPTASGLDNTTIIYVKVRQTFNNRN